MNNIPTDVFFGKKALLGNSFESLLGEKFTKKQINYFGSKHN